MKAIILNGFGGVENFQIAELDLIPPAADEVSVKVMSISINPVDVETRKGRGPADHVTNSDKAILGWDISGEVVAVGDSVKNFKVGDAVFGAVNFPGQGKAYATFVNAPEAHLAAKPGNISHNEAAAAGLAALVAMQALFDKAQIKAGDRVLIHGAEGGIGHFATQIARQAGAYVIGASNKEHRDFIIALGANEHLAYDETIFENAFKNIDIVLDTIGGNFSSRSIPVLKWGGHLVDLANGFRSDIADIAAYSGVNAVSMLASSNGSDMDKIAAILANGQLKSYIFKSFSFDNVPDAHLLVETGNIEGKVVVEVA